MRFFSDLFYALSRSFLRKMSVTSPDEFPSPVGALESRMETDAVRGTVGFPHAESTFKNTDQRINQATYGLLCRPTDDQRSHEQRC